MAKLLQHSALLASLLVSSVLGCAKSPEKPIVLRPTHPERRLASRAVAKRSATPIAPAPVGSAPLEAVSAGELPPPDEAPAAARPLSQTEKEALFEDFDRYLSRTRRAP